MKIIIWVEKIKPQPDGQGSLLKPKFLHSGNERGIIHAYQEQVRCILPKATFIEPLQWCSISFNLLRWVCSTKQLRHRAFSKRAQDHSCYHWWSQVSNPGVPSHALSHDWWDTNLMDEVFPSNSPSFQIQAQVMALGFWRKVWFS